MRTRSAVRKSEIGERATGQTIPCGDKPAALMDKCRNDNDERQSMRAPMQPSTRTPTARILLVEDDAEIAGMLIETFTDNGFQTTGAGSASDMERVLGTHAFDLIVLDVMLPGEDGFSICRRLRVDTTVPILMLTALGEDVDRIIGLELGADDYVTKPFNSRELLARIKSLLRRASYSAAGCQRQDVLTFAGWCVHPVSRQLCDPDGVHVSLTTAEFDLLLAFCSNPGSILTREQLLGLTHAGLAGPIERSIDGHISRLRQKIEPDPRAPVLIKTIRLGGYLFTPVVDRAR